MGSPLGADVSYLYGISGNRRSQAVQEMQRDPRKRRNENTSDSGSGISLEQRGEYIRTSSREGRSRSDLYPPNDSTISRKSRLDRGQRDQSPRDSLSRSRSKSPYRGGNSFRKIQDSGDPRDPRIGASNTRDEWTKTTDAFLKNIGTTTNKVNEQVNFTLK